MERSSRAWEGSYLRGNRGGRGVIAALAAGIGLASLLGARTARAAFELEWSAPAECPSADFVQAEVEKVVGRPWRELGQRWQSAQARVTPEGGGYRLRVAVVNHAGSASERDVLAASCTEAAEAAVAIFATGMAAEEQGTAGETAAAGATDSKRGADGSTLLGSSESSGNYYMVVAMHADELTNGELHMWNPIPQTQLPVSHATISPDGVWLAAAIQCPNEEWPSLWVSPLAISTPPCEGHRVTPVGVPSVLNPKWGPGNLIAYERATPPRDIAIVSADTGEECVVQGPGDDRNPSWALLADFASPQ